MKVGYHIRCYGTVQGVGFRFFTKEEADRLGLMGTVKNMEDGSVEIFVYGDNAPVLKFLKWCHNDQFWFDIYRSKSSSRKG